MEPKRLAQIALYQDLNQAHFVGELIGQCTTELFDLSKSDRVKISHQLQLVYEFLLKNEIWPYEAPQVECALLASGSEVIIQFSDKAHPWTEAQLRRDLAPDIFAGTDESYFDRVEALNLGIEGRRLQLGFPLTRISDDGHQSPVQDFIETKLDNISYRLLEPGEAYKMVSCMYSAYGYTYGFPDVYSHAETCNMMKSGRTVILAAESKLNKVAGITTLRKRVQASTIYDLCRTAVKPGYKGHRIFEKLLSNVIDIASDTLHAQGISATIPNRHLVSQDRLQKAGFIPVGIFLGIVPADFLPKQIGPFAQERESFLSVYKPINKPDYEVIYSPIQHEAIITRLCGQLGFKIPINKIAPNTVVGGRSKLERIEVDNMGVGFLEVHSAGSDIVDQIFENLAYLKRKHYGCIQLFLDLSDPAVMGYCDRFEAMGFFFAGFFPDEKPWLILQYLNNIPVLFDELIYPFPGSKYIQYHIQWLYRRVLLREKGEFEAAEKILPVPDLSQFPSDWRTDDDFIDGLANDESNLEDRPDAS